jgi:hypothetical protein
MDAPVRRDDFVDRTEHDLDAVLVADIRRKIDAPRL